MCDLTAKAVKCNQCGEMVHPEDTGSCSCYMHATQTKTITLPRNIADRIEAGDQTWGDMDYLRNELSKSYVDMVF